MKQANLDLANYFPYLINRVGVALVDRFTRDALQAKHLSIGTWRLLVATANHDGVRQVDLARLTSIEVSTVSRLVTRLVQVGLVARSRSLKSSREVIVRVTPKGRVLFSELIPVATALQKRATYGLTTKELGIARQVLLRMHENLHADRQWSHAAGQRGRCDPGNQRISQKRLRIEQDMGQPPRRKGSVSQA